jgi:phosphoglycerate dehydrogenase-like enzyme
LGDVDAELLVAEGGMRRNGCNGLPGADAILTCRQPAPVSALEAAPRCLAGSRYGIGLDNIPVEHATRLGIAHSLPGLHRGDTGSR